MVWTLPANGAGPSVTLAKRSHEGSHTHLAVVQKQQSAGHQSEPAPLAHFGHIEKTDSIESNHLCRPPAVRYPMNARR